MENITFEAVNKIQVVEQLNEEFTLCKCWVMSHGRNRNMSYISKETVEKSLPSLDYAPVVGFLYKNDKGEYRIAGHECHLDTEEWELIPDTQAFGVVKPNSYSWETVDEYGVESEYLCVELVMWTGRFKGLLDSVYNEDIYWAQSMEISVSEYRPWEEDSNYVEILEMNFSALCLLGKYDNPDENVTPCFINARVEPVKFSIAEFADQLAELKDKLFAFENKEGENVDENKTMQTEPNVTNPEVQGEPETFSNEGTEPTPKVEPINSVSQFQLTANEKWEKIGNAVRGLNKVTDSFDVWYYLEDFDDNYAYIERYVYNYAEDTCERKYGRVAYSIGKNEATINSEFEEMRVMWLTIEEAGAVEEARNNYSAVQAQNADFETQITALNEQISTLTPYKLAVEKAERDKAESEIFAKYDGRIGEMPEYILLKEKSSEYDLEQLDKECIMLVGKFAMNTFALKETKTPKTETMKFSVETTPAKVSPYGDIFERYGNND